MKSKKVLFLDDRSKRIHAALKKYSAPEYSLTIVATAKECIKMISNKGPWDIISLDHDLNYDEFVHSARKDCGMEVVRYMVDNKEMNAGTIVGSDGGHYQYIERVIIHSSNRVAATEMYSALKKAGYTVMASRFSYD